jgi:K+-sensing histidine kinase KdpD
MVSQDLGWLLLGVLAGWVACSWRWQRDNGQAAEQQVEQVTEPKVEQTIGQTIEPAALVFSEYFKSAFLARSAHELRSPLNSIIGLHQLILEDLCESPQEEREFVAQAKDATFKMLRVLDTLISVSKLQSGRDVPTLEPVPLHSIFSDVQELTILMAANRNLGLKVELPPEDWQVLSDAKWLRFLLVAWVDFAIVNQDLGTLSLWSEAQEPTSIAICFQVNLPLADLQTVLATISQGDIPETPTDAVDISQAQSIGLSAGLTLALSQQIIYLLKGQLMVASSPTDASHSILRCVLPSSI